MIKTPIKWWLNHPPITGSSLAAIATWREEPPLSEMLGVVVLKLSRNELTCHATFFYVGVSVDEEVSGWKKGL